MTSAATALAAAGCGGGGPSSGTASAPPVPTPRVVHAGPAVDLLVRLDELPVAGFTVAAAAAPLDAGAAAGGDPALSATLTGAGFTEGATVRYFRVVPTLRTANGPIDVISTVLRFGSVGGAAAAQSALAGHLDQAAGAIPTSTGPLGDGGHGTVVQVTDQGVTVAQATLVWRTGDLVSTLVVRERDTGAPLQDALILARPQLAREQV